MYRIETRDGVVIRKQATRPYQEAMVARDWQDKVVFAGPMTSKAKHADNQLIKTYTTMSGINVALRYERVVAIDLEKGKAE